MLVGMARSTLVSAIAMLVVACGAHKHADAATGPDAVLLALADLKWIENPERPGTYDGKETRLPPGAFYFVKGGKPHIAKCDPSDECIMTVDVRGKWDVIVEPKN